MRLLSPWRNAQKWFWRKKMSFHWFSSKVQLRVSGGATQTAWVTYWKFKIGRETQRNELCISQKYNGDFANIMWSSCIIWTLPFYLHCKYIRCRKHNISMCFFPRLFYCIFSSQKVLAFNSCNTCSENNVKSYTWMTPIINIFYGNL